MMMRRLVLRLAAAVMMAAPLLAAAPLPAAAQTQKVGDWTLVCAEGGDCALRQRKISSSNNILIADIALKLVRVNQQLRALLEVETLQNVALYVPASYIVDGRSPAVGLSWRVCVDGRCRAAALLSAEQQNALMVGNVMQLGYRIFEANENLTFPVSLAGVTAGLRALAAR